ncbi:hypothetical protein Ahia01_001026400 [Argonauta hians]
MAPMNWKKILKTTKKTLEDDSDLLFDMIKSFEDEDNTEVDRLRKLFQVTRDLLLLKNDQLEEVIVNMEQETKKEAKKEQKLQAKIKELENLNNKLKKSSVDGNFAPSNSRYLQEEVNHLNNQIHHLTEENLELQKDLDDEKRASERYSTQITDLDREKTILRQENDQMRQDISDYKMQLQSQRDFLLHQKEGDLEYKEKVLQKNRQLGEAMDELQNLTDANEELKNEIEKLTRKLSEATRDINQTTEDYLKLKKIVDDGDNTNDKLMEDNLMLKNQLADLLERLQVKCHSEDTIMVSVNEKVNEWRRILVEKDEDIISCHEEIMRLRKQLESVNLDADRSSLVALTKVVEERDQQIYDLTEEMKNLTAEMNSNAALIEELKDNLDKKPKDHFQRKLKEQQQYLSNKNQELKEAAKSVKEAENDAVEKDRQLLDAMERLHQYESGEYGLSEAVNEIKLLKKRLLVQQREVEEFVKHINTSETTINELVEENEILRTKLGMDPRKAVDVKMFRSDMNVKKEEQRALNIVLQKEIERLEEERIMLKQNLRKLAQQTGQRAVALGLTADDMVSIQNYTEDLKMKNISRYSSEIPENEDLKLKNSELMHDLKLNGQKLEYYKQQSVELKTINKRLEQDNAALLESLRELNNNINAGTSSGSEEGIVKCPSLEKVLQNMNSEKSSESSEVIPYLKEQIKNLENWNNELRTGFKDSCHETNLAKLEAERSNERVKKLEEELSNLQQHSYPAAGKVQGVALPENLSVSSAEIISRLNEHLIAVLGEVFSHCDQVKKCESKLESYHRKFAVMRHQVGLLYTDYFKLIQEHETTVKSLKEKNSQLEGIQQDNSVRLHEFDRLLDTLSQDESELLRRLSEQTRRMTVLEVNEKSLNRSYTAMAEMEKTARKEMNRRRSESIAMEKAVSEKIGYLQRFKSTASFKIDALQKALDDSVPAEELEKVNREYQSLTENYRNVLEREQTLLAKSESVASLKEELHELRSENQHINKILELEKDKVNVLSKNLVGDLGGITSSENEGHIVSRVSGQSAGQGTAYSSGQSVGQGTAYSSGQSAGQGTAYSSGQSAGQGTAYSSGQSAGQGTAYSSGHSVGQGTAYSSGHSAGQGTAYSSGQSVGQGTAYSSGHSVGQGTAYSSGQSAGQGTAYSSGQSVGQGTAYSSGQSAGQGTAYSSGHSAGQGTAYSSGQSVGMDVGYSSGQSVGQGTAYSSGQSAGQGTAYSSGQSAGQGTAYSSGQSAGQGTAYSSGHSVGQGTAYSSGQSVGQGTAYSSGQSVGQGVGYTSGQSVGQGTAYSSGQSVGQGTAYSSGQSVGMDVGYSSGQSAGQGTAYSSGQSVGQGVGYTSGQSVGQGTAYSSGQSVGQGVGYTSGQSVGQGVGYTSGQSVGQGTAYSSGQSVGQGTAYSSGQSVGQGTAYTSGQSVGQGTAYSSGQSAGQGTAYSSGQSVGQGTAYSSGQSVGQGVGYTSGQSVDQGTAYSSGHSVGQGVGYTSGQSAGQGTAYSSGQSVGQGTAYSSGQSVGQGTAYTSGQSAGQGTAYSSGQSVGQGTAYTSGQSVGQGTAYSSVQSVGQGVGYTSGQSVGQGTAYSSGQSVGQGTAYSSGQSVGQGTAYSSGQSVGQGTAYSSGQSVGQGVGYTSGQSVGQGTAYSSGQSAGQGTAYSSGQSVGQGVGYTSGQSDSQGPVYTNGQSSDQVIGQTGGQVISQTESQVIGQSGDQTIDQVISQTEGQVTGQTGGQVIGQSVKVENEEVLRKEISELHEKQRAEHAVHMYDKSKHMIAGLERRIIELEQNLQEVSQLNMNYKKAEEERRELLSRSSVSRRETDQKTISKLEENEVLMKSEISKLKEISDVATSQVLAFESQQNSRDKEVASLRQQLLDIQSQTEEKTIIGKLHRQIVQLQVSEGTAMQKYENLLRKVSKLDAQILQLEQLLDLKNQAMFRSRSNSQNTIKQLKRSLSDMSRQYAGSIPLSKQEKFAKNMMRVQEDKEKVEQELVEIKEKYRQSEEKLAEYELVKFGREELKELCIKGNQDVAKKLAEWHSKMETLRLKEMKQSRHISRLQEQLTLYENTIKNQETAIAELEEKDVKSSKEFEKQQLNWEFREQEMERTISNLEKQAAEFTSATALFTKNVGNLPDRSQPLAVQLEDAITTIKENRKEIADSRAQCQLLNKKVKELQAAVEEAETNILAKDKLITEIRLQIPATVDRDIFLKNFNTAMGGEKSSNEDRFEAEQAIKVAHTAVSSLKARIQLKEESIQNLQELLKTAHEDMEKMTQKHYEELQSMQLKMQQAADRSYLKFKEAATQLVKKPNKDDALKKQVLQMSALEDLIAERDGAMSSLVIQIKTKNEEILALRMKVQQIIGEKDHDKEELLQKHDAEICEKNKEREMVSEQVKALAKELQLAREEVSCVKAANLHTPNTNMVRLTEQLRNQLQQKENQIQALNKALCKLRTDLLEQTEVTTQMQQTGKQLDAQLKRKVEKQTEVLTTEIEEIRSQNEKLKIDLKKKHEKENNLRSELQEVCEKLEKKNSVIQKLKQEKQQNNQQIVELERQIERMKGASQKAQDGDRSELAEMKRKVLFLEEEAKARQQQAEKPYEQMKIEKPKNVEVVKWEEKKKWEKTVEKMKGKIKSAELETGRLQQEVTRLRAALDRLKQEKDSSDNRSKAVSKSKSSSGITSAVDDLRHVQELEQLKELNYKQTEEMCKLKRQLLKHEDEMVKEVAEENKHLQGQLQQYKMALDSKFLEQKENPNCKEYQALFDKNQQLQKQLLQVSKENIEIHFEMEEAKKDVPRLKARVDDLQTYIEALKAENKRLGGDRSEVTKVGESGKSPKELEKIIALLKKVVDRVQKENDQLKKCSVTTSLDGQEKSLKLENLDLIQKVKDLQKKLDQSSSDKHLTKEKGMAKLMADYEKLRKDLLRETDLKVKFQDQADILNEELKKLKSVADSRICVRGGASTTSIINSEETIKTQRIKKLEEELDNKRQKLSDLKLLLGESAEREQTLLQEKQQLLVKIKHLENIPDENHATDAALNHAYRKAKLTISELQTERNDLFKEVKLLQQKLHGEVPKITEDMLLKARNYDSLISKNATLTVQVKTLKLEKDKQSSEIFQLKAELKNFGPEFFEEIEDLKFNYKEAMKRLKHYENNP